MMSQAAFTLLSTLLQVGPEGASRQHLVARAGIAISTFYRVLKPLLQDGLVVEDGQRYRLPMGNLHNFRFKLWHDAHRLWQLPPADRTAVLDMVTHARTQLKDNLRVLWLVGSAASDTMTPDSDLDFLALVQDDVLYHPSSQRSVNFVMMTEASFEEGLSHADDFIVAALRSGLVLFDGGQAQAIYERPLSVGLSAGQAQNKEADIVRQRERLRRSVGAEDVDSASRALQAMVIKIVWRMLRTLDLLPPPKVQLVALCEAYFGARFATKVKQAIGRRAMPLTRQLDLSREFEDIDLRFNQALSHLKAYAALPTAGGVPFQQLCLELCRELFPHDRVQAATEPGGFDVSVRHGDVRYVFECVSRDRVEGATLESFVAKLARLGGTVCPVLLANAERKVPVLERHAPPFTEAVMRTAHQHGIRLVTGLDLLRAHNRLHLEDLTVDQVERELFGDPPSNMTARHARLSQKR